MVTVGINSSHGSRLRQNTIFRGLCPKTNGGKERCSYYTHLYLKGICIWKSKSCHRDWRGRDKISFFISKTKADTQTEDFPEAFWHHSYRGTSICDGEIQGCVLLMANRIHFFPLTKYSIKVILIHRVTLSTGSVGEKLWEECVKYLMAKYWLNPTCSLTSCRSQREWRSIVMERQALMNVVPSRKLKWKRVLNIIL